MVLGLSQKVVWVPEGLEGQSEGFVGKSEGSRSKSEGFGGKSEGCAGKSEGVKIKSEGFQFDFVVQNIKKLVTRRQTGRIEKYPGN